MSAAAPARLVALDGLRGVAVMGIVLMNVAAFALPFAAYDNPVNYGAAGPADIALWAIEFVLVDGKMRAIFSMLFGASLLIVADRAEAAGRNAARVHFARMGTLLGFGLIHGCLIWNGDILALYALVGMAAFALRRLPAERLVVVAVLLLIVQACLSGLHYQALYALQEAASLPGADPDDVALWREVLDSIGRPGAAALAADLALHRGPWLPLAADMTATRPATLAAELWGYGPATLGLMALGMAGLRSGFLAGHWAPLTYRRIGRWSYAIGLPPLVLIAAWLISTGLPPLGTAIATDLVALPFIWIVALGHAAFLLPWLALSASPVRLRIAAAGRMAFSNYLGTSLILAALFDGWGLGLYGWFDRGALLLVVAGVWLAMLGWSKPWLDRFHYGPLEWLWRALARGERPSWRRQAIAS